MARKKKSQNIIDGWRMHDALCHAGLSAMEWDPWIRHSYMDEFCQKSFQKKRNSARTDHSVEYDYIAYRFRGFPDAKQEHQLRCTAGCTRFLWNRMLADYLDLYRIMGVTVKNTPADYKSLDELSFLNDVDSFALANVQLQLESAISDWQSGEKGKPRFKKKNLNTDSYTTNMSHNNIKLEDGSLVLPKVPGKIEVRTHRPVAAGGKLKNVTVTLEPDGSWQFAIVFAYPKQEEQEFTWESVEDLNDLEILGLDMSLPHMYVDSNGNFPQYELDGIVVEFEKWYTKQQGKIAKAQKKLSRMVKGSSNYTKQCRKITKLHAKTKHRRSDFLHQMACRLARRYDVIAVEDLNLSAMKKALKFGKSVSDNAWGTFLTILKAQCRKYGHMVLFVSKWFPSTKTCSCCGYIHKEIKLKDRTYVCPECGNTMDRDKQAAINLKNEAVRILQSNRETMKKQAA